MNIRSARREDAAELAAIYAPYVLHTAITFEFEPPTPEEFLHRMEGVMERYPYLAAEENGRILGYCYASRFKNRPAYDWSVETSIYVREDCRRRGVGAALYARLEELLKRQGVVNLEACIALPEVEDETLTLDSVRFHSALGYREVGRFLNSGCKGGRWYHMVWMEKCIGAHTSPQPPFIPFPELRLG